MQQIYVTRTLPDVYLVRDYLAAEGVPTEIRNEHLFGAQGEVPVTADTLPSLWTTDEHVARARELIEAHRNADGTEAAAALAAMDTDASPAAQAAMSQLFDVADRLSRGADGALVEEVRRLGGVIAGSAPPFGVDPALWERTADLARRVVRAAPHDAEDGVESAAGDLRDVLRTVV